MTRTKSKSSKDSTATIGFEAKLWVITDKLRNKMDAAECKHVVLGLIFLKYISDIFEEHRAKPPPAAAESVADKPLEEIETEEIN